MPNKPAAQGGKPPKKPKPSKGGGTKQEVLQGTTSGSGQKLTGSVAIDNAAGNAPGAYPTVPGNPPPGPWVSGEKTGKWEQGAQGPWESGQNQGPWASGTQQGPWESGAQTGKWEQGAVGQWKQGGGAPATSPGGGGGGGGFTGPGAGGGGGGRGGPAPMPTPTQTFGGAPRRAPIGGRAYIGADLPGSMGGAAGGSAGGGAGYLPGNAAKLPSLANRKSLNDDRLMAGGPVAALYQRKGAMVSNGPAGRRKRLGGPGRGERGIGAPDMGQGGGGFPAQNVPGQGGFPQIPGSPPNFLPMTPGFENASRGLNDQLASDEMAYSNAASLVDPTLQLALARMGTNKGYQQNGLDEQMAERGIFNSGVRPYLAQRDIEMPYGRGVQDLGLGAANQYSSLASGFGNAYLDYNKGTMNALLQRALDAAEMMPLSLPQFGYDMPTTGSFGPTGTGGGGGGRRGAGGRNRPRSRRTRPQRGQR